MVIHEVWRDHVEYRQLKNKIIEMAVKYNVSSINVEDVAAQRIVIDDIKHEPKIARYPIKGHRPRGDKLARALPWVSRLELNMLALQAGKWNEVFLEECTTFDGKNGEHDDMIDSVSMAYDVLYNNSVAMGQKVKY
jgi:predicted phage terminase large subunit-like protein